MSRIALNCLVPLLICMIAVAIFGATGCQQQSFATKRNALSQLDSMQLRAYYEREQQDDKSRELQIVGESLPDGAEVTAIEVQTWIAVSHGVTGLGIGSPDGDPDFSVLRQFPALRSLSLADYVVSDRHMREISRAELDHLNLANTQVSDASVPHLLLMKSLKYLNVAETRITSDGIRRLRDDLKECTVVDEDEVRPRVTMSGKHAFE